MALKFSSCLEEVLFSSSSFFFKSILPSALQLCCWEIKEGIIAVQWYRYFYAGELGAKWLQIFATSKHLLHPQECLAAVCLDLSACWLIYHDN